MATTAQMAANIVQSHAHTNSQIQSVVSLSLNLLIDSSNFFFYLFIEKETTQRKAFISFIEVVQVVSFFFLLYCHYNYC
jgi:hypothetical protein